jgi:alanine racemase
MYSPRDIGDILGVDTTHKATPTITSFHIDSRRVTNPSSTLFFCLPGARTDGHDHVTGLYERGCRCFVVSKKIDIPTDAILFRVEDVLLGLHTVARAHRKKMNVPILAITGSNGKTIIKEWLFQLLSPFKDVYRSPGSYNSKIGVPLSLLGIRPHHELAIIEVGISEKGEMAPLQEMVDPDFGIFSFLGSAHDAGFDSREEKLKEKISLFRDVQWWISQKKYTIRQSDNAVILEDQGIEHDDRGFTFQGLVAMPPFHDQASIDNIYLCLAFIRKWNEGLLAKAFAITPRLASVSMRAQVRKGLHGNTIIADHYNADIEGLSNVLQLASEINPGDQKVLILSDFLDVKDTKALWELAIHRMGQYGIGEVAVVGEQWDMIGLQGPASMEIECFSSTKQIIDSGYLDSIHDKVVILKGGRRFQFEQIENQLVRPVFKTRLEVDLSALRFNWSQIGEILNSEVRRLVMIKAAGYGSGLVEMGRLFEDLKADYLGVAYPHEGLQLREGSVGLPILVMNAEPEVVPLLIRHKLEPVVYSLRQLTGIIDQLGPEDSLHIHLKINTGMNRLGFDHKDIAPLLSVLAEHAQLQVASVMSHLSASDDPAKDAFSMKQFQEFDEVVQWVVQKLGYSPLQHILNSHGVLRFPGQQRDMVRLGVALYGGTDKQGQTHLRPVHRLITYIAQLRWLEKGEAIGYGADIKTKRRSLIATIAIGYADGIFRHLGEGRLKVVIRDQIARNIGRVCMDMIMLDVTDIEGVNEGDEVVIFGEKITLHDYAKAANTIPYEVLVHIGDRVERVFINA